MSNDQNTENNSKLLVVNLNSVEWRESKESDIQFKIPAGIVLKSGYTGSSSGRVGTPREKDITYTCQLVIKPDDLDSVLYPVDKIAVVKREFPEGKHNITDVKNIHYRLFYSKKVTEKIKLSQLIDMLDDYQTFWDSAKSIYKHAEAFLILNDPIYNLHECYSFNGLEIQVVTNSREELIGWVIRNADCGEDDSGIFLFKNHAICGEILLQYMYGISVEFIPGGYTSLLAELFSIPFPEFKTILAVDDFILMPKYFGTIQYEKKNTKFEEIIN